MAIILSVIGHWLNLLPTLERALVITALMVTLMTYVSSPASSLSGSTLTASSVS